MYDFKKAALKATELSHLMNDRNKASTEEIIKKYKGEITITAVDIAEQNDGVRYCVLNFAEDKDAFYCGGIVLTKIVDAWLDDFAGNFTKLNAALAESGGLKVKMKEEKTKSNNNITAVQVL